MALFFFLFGFILCAFGLAGLLFTFLLPFCVKRKPFRK